MFSSADLSRYRTSSRRSVSRRSRNSELDDLGSGCALMVLFSAGHAAESRIRSHLAPGSVEAYALGTRVPRAGSERAVSALPSSKPTSESSKARLRFRGFSADTPRFLRSLESDPCPSEWPGGERVAYLTHVLSPLKALVHDLQELLADVRPKLGLEARVGASLHWTLGSRSVSGDCPVRRIRVWDALVPADESPELFAALSSDAIELGLDAAGGDPEATSRVRAAALRERSTSGSASETSESRECCAGRIGFKRAASRPRSRIDSGSCFRCST
jgi:hypothetical protein